MNIDLILDLLILVSWDGESLQCATPDFGVLLRGRTPKSMIHHL